MPHKDARPNGPDPRALHRREPFDRMRTDWPEDKRTEKRGKAAEEESDEGRERHGLPREAPPS